MATPPVSKAGREGSIPSTPAQPPARGESRRRATGPHIDSSTACSPEAGPSAARASAGRSPHRPASWGLSSAWQSACMACRRSPVRPRQAPPWPGVLPQGGNRGSRRAARRPGPPGGSVILPGPAPSRSSAPGRQQGCRTARACSSGWESTRPASGRSPVRGRLGPRRGSEASGRVTLPAPAPRVVAHRQSARFGTGRQQVQFLPARRVDRPPRQWQGRGCPKAV
jgi:hypothetical protein